MTQDASTHPGGPRFHLVHIETGLFLGQYKVKHPLHYYSPSGSEWTDSDFAHFAIRPILRADGAVGFQNLKPGYDDGDLYYLPRNEWTVRLE